MKLPKDKVIECCRCHKQELVTFVFVKESLCDECAKLTHMQKEVAALDNYLTKDKEKYK